MILYFDKSDSPYSGSIFFLDIYFPSNYLLKPPEVYFIHIIVAYFNYVLTYSTLDLVYNKDLSSEYWQSSLYESEFSSMDTSNIQKGKSVIVANLLYINFNQTFITQTFVNLSIVNLPKPRYSFHHTHLITLSRLVINYLIIVLCIPII